MAPHPSSLKILLEDSSTRRKGGSHSSHKAVEIEPSLAKCRWRLDEQLGPRRRPCCLSPHFAAESKGLNLGRVPLPSSSMRQLPCQCLPCSDRCMRKPSILPGSIDWLTHVRRDLLKVHLGMASSSRSLVFGISEEINVRFRCKVPLPLPIPSSGNSCHHGGGCEFILLPRYRESETKSRVDVCDRRRTGPKDPLFTHWPA
jgi:hypothetical protein